MNAVRDVTEMSCFLSAMTAIVDQFHRARKNG